MKKKTMKLLLKIFLSLVVVGLSIYSIFSIDFKANAKNELNDSPYNTYAVGLEGELVASPLAYEGINVITLDFINPCDIYIDSNNIAYIADKDLKCIVRYNIDTKEVTRIGEGILKGPTGVTTDKDGNIYAADKTGGVVVKFDS